MHATYPIYFTVASISQKNSFIKEEVLHMNNEDTQRKLLVNIDRVTLNSLELPIYTQENVCVQVILDSYNS